MLLVPTLGKLCKLYSIIAFKTFHLNRTRNTNCVWVLDKIVAVKLSSKSLFCPNQPWPS